METKIMFSPISIEELIGKIEKIVEEKLNLHILSSPPPLKPENFGTRKEVSKELRISLPTLNELTKNGELKAYRIGGRVLYKWEEVINSLKEIQASKYRRK